MIFKLGSYDIADQIVDVGGSTRSYGDGRGIIIPPAKYLKKWIRKGSRISFKLKKG